MPPFMIPVPGVTAKDVAVQLQSMSNETNAYLAKRCKAMFDLVYHHPTLTAPQVVAAMGTQAIKLFTLSADATTLLTHAGETGEYLNKPDGYNYTINPNGSVVVTVKA